MSLRSISNVTVPANQISVPPPAGIVDGDILVAFFVADTPAAGQTFPAGFTQIPGSPAHSTADGQTLAVATKKASGESGNYVIGAGSADATSCVGGVACFSGRDATVFLHRTSVAQNNTLNPSPWTITSSAFSSNTAGICDILLVAASDVNNGATAHSTPAGFTERADISDGGFLALAVDTKDDVAAGETGVYSLTGTSAAHSAGWDVFAIALLQAAGGGGTTGPNGDRYLLEGGAGVLLLEAAAGALLLEQATGVLSRLVPMQVFNAVAAVAVAATMAATVPMQTFSAQAAVADSGVIAKTVPMQTFAASATVTDTGTIAKTVPIQTFAAQASVTVTGGIAVTVPIQTFTGQVSVPVTGTHSPVVPMQTMTAQGAIPITGQLAVTVPMQRFAAAGTPGTLNTTGVLAVTVPMQIFASAGTVTITGVIARMVPMQSFAASGSASGGPVVNTNGVLTATVPMALLAMSGTALFPTPPSFDLPLGATRVVFDASRMTVRFDVSRTSVTLDPSRRRVVS